MSNNLSLYTTTFSRMRQLLPRQRITQVRNLALLMTGLVLARSVHLDRISNKLPLPAKIPSLSNRLRRFLSNPRWRESETVGNRSGLRSGLAPEHDPEHDQALDRAKAS